jgi:hypothetical protein
MNEAQLRSLATEADIRHTGMSRDFFIRSVKRALDENASIYLGPSPRIVLIPSSEGNGMFYSLNKTWCTCLGHEHTGRCWHRAFYIFHSDVLELEPVKRASAIEQTSGRPARSA